MDSGQVGKLVGSMRATVQRPSPLTTSGHSGTHWQETESGAAKLESMKQIPTAKVTSYPAQLKVTVLSLPSRISTNITAVTFCKVSNFLLRPSAVHVHVLTPCMDAAFSYVLPPRMCNAVFPRASPKVPTVWVLLLCNRSATGRAAPSSAR